MPPLKPLLIESWLPIEAIGAESQRERGYGTPFPAPVRLHVWWARRPLITSRSAILAGLLPEYSDDWPEDLRKRFLNTEQYHKWVVELLGIRGDPAKSRKLASWARSKGIGLKYSPYDYPRAFTINPDSNAMATMMALLEWTWGKQDLNILDSFAGGGSIPFEALRYGFNTFANDLNPVAAVILKATLDYPFKFGSTLTDDINTWGKKWYELVKPRLSNFFTPLPPNAEGADYLWVRTVACPTTGKPVPLNPNWWLRSSDNPVAVNLIAEANMNVPIFEIITGSRVNAANPDNGTITRGIGRSPWTGETIDGDYIKAEAQSGRMGQMLYAIATKVQGGFEFRSPTDADIQAIKEAENELSQKRDEWESKNYIPTELIPNGNKTSELHRYGMKTWADLFSPRQLLAMGTFVETLHEIESNLNNAMDNERAKAVYTYLSLCLGKCINYSARLSSWNAKRGAVRSVFDRHDFAFAWSHSEFDLGDLLPWAIRQVADAYRDLTKLASPTQTSFISKETTANNILSQGSANDLPHIPDSSIDNITVDPPYYDNVQYAELSDFFYVWLKRSVGHLYPEFFRDELTNKDDEAVANPARFASMGKKKKELAEQDYENKMTAAFREMYRVLRPEGALTVMFTHKKVEAWNTLASALINAGFVIKASWPVHTESEHSLHQAKKNAAASTILLVCRKRDGLPSTVDGLSSGEATWWDDLAPRVREAARQKAEEFSAQGISGVDLYISTFGPALSIISEHWPVLTSEVDPKTGQPKPLRPETALDLAREEVVRLRKQGLLAGRDVRFDPVTDWVLMAWDAFHAEEFPYDEGRKLAIALGVDMDRLIMTSKRLAIKKSNSVVLQVPAKRSKKDMVDPDLATFEHWIDAAHTAMLVYEEDGAGACDVFLRKANLKNDNTFKALLQSMINAIPRARIKGKFARPEAETLENLRLAFFPELTVPVEEEPQMPAEKQMSYLDEAVEVDEEESDEGEE
jgi:putative DNA methylase